MEIDGYRYTDGESNSSHKYLLPGVEKLIRKKHRDLQGVRVFDLGCGNGSVASHFAAKGAVVTGIDPSVEGIRNANATYPGLNLANGSAYDPLCEQYGRFSIVLSLEVIEHLYFPRRFANTLYELTEPGGTAIVSTPYHGYWKNLAMAVTGRMESHFTVLWDHGHIKFWSRRTLTKLLSEAGFDVQQVIRVGRIPALAKSMIVSAQRPARP